MRQTPKQIAGVAAIATATMAAPIAGYYYGMAQRYDTIESPIPWITECPTNNASSDGNPCLWTNPESGAVYYYPGDDSK